MTKGESEYKKGLWTEEEDRILIEYIRDHGRRHWNRIPKLTGLMRNGKSCRLRWLNYLSPNVKHGSFSEEEDDLIIRLHNLLGNRWSLIAGRVPGRTDNQVKNHWNTHLCKKLGLNKQSAKLRDKAPSKPMASPHVEGNSAPSDLQEEKETQVLDAQENCLDNNCVAAMDEAQHWPAGELGIIKDNFDQSFMFEFDIGDNFVLDSPPAPGLMELFDGYDIL